MAYRLRKNEPVAEGLKRLAASELTGAAAVLEKDNVERAVHEARKSIKKTRALLRLVREELGERYRQEDRQLRNVGRRLSELRDASAVLRNFESLVGKQEAGKEDALHAIRRGLEGDKRKVEEAARGRQAVEHAVVELRAVSAHVSDWPLQRDGFSAMVQGVDASFRRGRRMFKKADKDASAENFHELRKRVKEHWYHLRLLEGAWDDALRLREQSLKKLGEWLGEDHNLTVLRERLIQPGAFDNSAEMQSFVGLAEGKQKELRTQSMALAANLYREKPRVFLAEIEAVWKSWRKSAEEAPAKKRPAQIEKRARKATAAA